MPFLLPEIPELRPNRLAMPLVKQLIANQKLLNIDVFEKDGVHIIDCGVKALGGWEAGVLFAKICMGGLGRVDVRWADFKGFQWPSVQVVTDHPLRACMLSQFAGWPIQARGFSALGSGPGRAVANREELFAEFGCVDPSENVIICLESERIPSEDAIQDILCNCQCKRTNLYILVAPTSSIVGSIQIAARTLETGLYKLKIIGYDITSIRTGWGICPLPPVTPNGTRALGRTNDAIRYGASVYYNVIDEDLVLQSIIKQVPTSASPEYGHLFTTIIDQSDNFYDIDPLFFSPAEIWITNLKSGRCFHAGTVRPELLQAAFEMDY